MQKALRHSCAGPESRRRMIRIIPLLTIHMNGFTSGINLHFIHFQNEVSNQSMCTGQQINVAEAVHNAPVSPLCEACYALNHYISNIG